MIEIEGIDYIIEDGVRYEMFEGGSLSVVTPKSLAKVIEELRK